MARIVDYQILSDEDQELLEKAVRAFVRNGWQPFGSFSTLFTGVAVWHYQPIVKYEEPVPAPKPELPPGVTLASAVLAETIR